MPAPSCPICRGSLWLCADHSEPWPHDGCDAEGVACVCNPKAQVAWREVIATNEDPGPVQ